MTAVRERLRLGASVVVSIAALVGTSAADAVSWNVIGHGRAAGQVAPAFATGTAKKPSAIAVRVLLSRRQLVKVTAVVVCTKENRVATKSAKFRTRSGIVRPVTLPIAAPFRCDVTSIATIYHGGTIRLQILAHR
jgi:hypothetical protein